MKDRIRSFVKNNKFDALAFSLSAASIPLQHHIEATISPEWLTTPFRYDLVYNSGDFAEAIIFGSLANMAIKKISPNAERSHQLLAASAISAGGIMLLESHQFPKPISYVTGFADLRDVGFGLAGVAVYLIAAAALDRNPRQRRRAI